MLLLKVEVSWCFMVEDLVVFHGGGQVFDGGGLVFDSGGLWVVFDGGGLASVSWWRTLGGVDGGGLAGV